MRESIHQYFQVGVIHHMSFAGCDPVSTMRRIASDDFFDAVELTHMPDPAAQAACKALLDSAHMTVAYGAQPRLLGKGLNVNALEEPERLRAQQELFDALDDARRFGADGISFLAGKWHPETRDEAYAQLVRTTRAVCDYAAERGMFVELEVFDYDMDKAALIGPAPYAARFAADIRLTHHNFGLLVDLSHFPTTYESSAFVIQTLRPYITHFHIGNAVVKQGCAAYGDMHPRFGFPDSANDVPELLDFFRVLKREGFFNADHPLLLSFEVKPWKDEDAEMVLAGTKRVLNRAWALLED